MHKTNAGLSRSLTSNAKLNLLHSIEINRFPGLPEVELILHGKPAFRAAPQVLREPQRHFGADAAATLQDPIQCGRCNTERCHKLPAVPSD